MKYCLIDVETTGLDPQRHSIYSIACMVRAGEGKLHRASFTCQPMVTHDISLQALSLGDVTLEEMLTYPKARDAKKALEEFWGHFVEPKDRADKFLFVAYNARFDYDFLRAWFEAQGDRFFGSWFWFPPIDIMGLAAYVLRDERHTMQDFKLGTVARHLGVEVKEEEQHDALYDLNLSVEVIRKLNERQEEKQHGTQDK